MDRGLRIQSFYMLSLRENINLTGRVLHGNWADIVTGRNLLRLLVSMTLQWRHNDRDGVLNHRLLHCWLNCRFKRRSKNLQSSVSLAFVRGIHQWPVNSPRIRPTTPKSFHWMTSLCMSSPIVKGIGTWSMKFIFGTNWNLPFCSCHCNCNKWCEMTKYFSWVAVAFKEWWIAVLNWNDLSSQRTMAGWKNNLYSMARWNFFLNLSDYKFHHRC